MVNRLRTGWMAGSGALVLVLALSGGVLGATLATDTEPAPELTEPVDTTATFEDLDGDGIDDDCAESVVADPEAAAAAFAAADLDGDGQISVTEAARSGWTGGLNCNHGGYVSQVATADEEAEEEVEEEAEELETAEEGECEAVPAPEPETELDPTAPNSHGAWVSWVAQSAAVGGKNCNHGGAVSEAAKKDKEAARAEREAAKAERAAAKAERAAARELRAQEREAAKAARQNGNGKGKNR
ncbi:MAG TPA: hypothetical protein VLA44_05040 [Clostridia bacterium]|nr:hypothetical protein [Clostridia bacterium]